MIYTLVVNKLVASRINLRYCELVANFTSHALAGAAAGALAYLIWAHSRNQTFDLGQLFLCGGVGTAAGVAADVLEPAIHSHHRAFFHSLAFGGAGALTVARVCRDPNTCHSTALLALAASLGYGSHLLLDAMTPRGLPLI